MTYYFRRVYYDEHWRNIKNKNYDELSPNENTRLPDYLSDFCIAKKTLFFIHVAIWVERSMQIVIAVLALLLNLQILQLAE